MVLFNKQCASLSNLRNIVRLISNSSHTSQHALDFGFKPKFTDEEQNKVLHTLNESNVDELLNFNISQTKIKNLKNYRNKNGPFKSLSDILEVDGLGIKLLEKLCEHIIKETPEPSVKKAKSTNGHKRVKQLLTPILKGGAELTSAVGVHLDPTGVSWAKLCKSNNFLQNWGYEDLALLPKKMLPTETFDLAMNVLDKVPFGDVYIFEGTASMSPSGQKQAAVVCSYTQQLELMSMLLALLNTSSKHNRSLQNVENGVENKVYFLKSKLPARLFKTLVGNERVSATTTISQLLDTSNNVPFSLNCSPISVDRQVKDDYLELSAPHKELMAHALMLIIAFSDLCVHKNVVSLNAVGISSTK